MIRRARRFAALGLLVALGAACSQEDTQYTTGVTGIQPDSGGTPRAGEVCESNKQCAEDEYCAVAEGECGRLGVCTAIPLECERERPVCGCEGVTYFGGACEAAQSGESVDFQGECPPPPCTSNAQCGGTEYCARLTGDCGGSGACTERPLQCSNVYSPVCGCNGVTYGNSCKAAKAGVTVAKAGAC